MAGLKKRRRIHLVIAAAALSVAAVAIMGYAFRDGIELFRSPTQLSEAPPAEGERFRLGGLVAEGSWERNGPNHAFTVTDGGATTPVRFEGIVPDLFREGQGVVATGVLEDGVFVASEILAKHDETYMPREVADALKEQGHFRPGE